MTLSQIVLVGIVILIPVIGFASTISYARKADTAREQRWRKGHGVLYWVVFPTAFGLITLMSAVELLPKVFSLIAILLLAGSTFLSWTQARKREE